VAGCRQGFAHVLLLLLLLLLLLGGARHWCCDRRLLRRGRWAGVDLQLHRPVHLHQRRWVRMVPPPRKLHVPALPSRPPAGSAVQGSWRCRASATHQLLEAAAVVVVAAALVHERLQARAQDGNLSAHPGGGACCRIVLACTGQAPHPP
jgi:hypothetical protein